MNGKMTDKSADKLWEMLDPIEKPKKRTALESDMTAIYVHFNHPREASAKPAQSSSAV